jgi:hypothetical protein
MGLLEIVIENPLKGGGGIYPEHRLLRVDVSGLRENDLRHSATHINLPALVESH